MLTQISNANSGQNLFVDPEDVSSGKSVCVSGSRQISDEGLLRVGQVLVRLGAVSRVEAHEGRNSALTFSRVTSGL